MSKVWLFLGCFVLLTGCCMAASIRQSEVPCKTEGCQTAYNLISASMNPSANPCDDFYEYACGRYGLPARKDNVDELQGSELYLARIDETVTSFLTQRISSTQRMLEAEKNAIRFFKSCTRYGKELQRDHRHSIKFIHDVADALGGGFRFSSQSKLDPAWTIETSLVRAMHFATHSAGLFQFVVERDLWNYTRNALTLMPPSTFLFGDKSYFKALYNSEGKSQDRYVEKLEKVKKHYVAFLRRLAVYLHSTAGVEIDDASLQNLAEFEIHLAKITPPFNSSATAYELGQFGMREVTVDGVQEVCPALDWRSLFKQIATKYQVRSLAPNQLNSVKIAISDSNYFKNLSVLIERTLQLPNGDKTLHNYQILMSIQPYLCSLAPSISDAYSVLTKAVNFDSKRRLGGIICPDEQDEARHRHDRYMCTESTKSYFGPVVSREFLFRYFSDDSKASIEQIAKSIRFLFVDLLSNRTQSSWLDEQTRQHAIAKAESMLFAVGYSDVVMDDANLERKYGNAAYGPLSSDAYLDNSVAIANGFNRQMFQLLDESRPSRTDDWPGLLPIDQNAQYHMTKNVVQFPAASGVEPYYRDDFPPAAGWGGVAQPLAHEFTHAFDSTGRHYDKRGQVSNWWSPEAVREFNRRAQCLVDQYASFEAVKTHHKIDHSKTLDDNIADVTGLKLAYHAFRVAMGTRRLSQIELGIMTNEQLFFVMSAMGHCDAGLTRVEGEIATTTTKPVPGTEVADVHAAAKHRVWGMMMNLDEFSRAFNCPSGSRMNPPKKCQVW